MKKYAIILFALIFLIFSMPLAPLAESKEQGARKDEVVYVNFTADGTMEEIYVVNSFDIIRSGHYSDYGSYSEVKNVTNLEEIKIDEEEDKVEFSAEEGKFHYQGTLVDKVLPWQFSITYFLDGKKIEPQYLAGKDGHLKIKIKSKQNTKGEAAFFENYLVQIGATFDTDHVDNIKTEKGMIANAGEDKQVNFTVMPEEEELTLEADVLDFTFSGFEINAVPSFLAIDEPDVSDMEGDMNTLQKAIRDINNGVNELRKGISALHAAAGELHAGSAEYKAGMDELAREVKGASAELDAAFKDLDEIMAEVGEIDFAEVESLLEELADLPNELKAMQKDIGATNKAFQASYKQLDKAIKAIPDHHIAEAELAALYEADVDEKVVDQLIEYYETGRNVRLIYKEVSDDFAAAAQSFDDLTDALDVMLLLMNEVLESIEAASSVSDISADMQELTASYEAFHQGIQALTNGIISLATAYGEIHDGIRGLKDGAGQLENGANSLYDGTSELKKATDQLPNKLTEEIDELLAKYDKSDFEPISFVSDKNKKIETVQFVMKTAKIKKLDEDEGKTKEKAEKSIWQKFLNLFTLKK